MTDTQNRVERARSNGNAAADRWYEQFLSKKGVDPTDAELNGKANGLLKEVEKALPKADKKTKEDVESLLKWLKVRDEGNTPSAPLYKLSRTMGAAILLNIKFLKLLRHYT